jgi:hypothetical protein
MIQTVNEKTSRTGSNRNGPHTEEELAIIHQAASILGVAVNNLPATLSNLVAETRPLGSKDVNVSASGKQCNPSDGRDWFRWISGGGDLMGLDFDGLLESDQLANSAAEVVAKREANTNAHLFADLNGLTGINLSSYTSLIGSVTNNTTGDDASPCLSGLAGFPRNDPPFIPANSFQGP